MPGAYSTKAADAVADKDKIGVREAETERDCVFVVDAVPAVEGVLVEVAAGEKVTEAEADAMVDKNTAREGDAVVDGVLERAPETESDGVLVVDGAVVEEGGPVVETNADADTVGVRVADRAGEPAGDKDGGSETDMVAVAEVDADEDADGHATSGDETLAEVTTLTRLLLESPM